MTLFKFIISYSIIVTYTYIYTHLKNHSLSITILPACMYAYGVCVSYHGGHYDLSDPQELEFQTVVSIQ